MKRTLLFAAAAIGLALSAQAQPKSYPPGIDLAGMDKSVAPGDDFFHYANGTWIKTTEIPADRSAWGSGGELAEKTTAETAELIRAAQHAKPGTAARKVGDYYAAYMDEARIETLGLSPLKPTLARIAAIKDKKALAAEFGRELRADVDALNSTNFQTDHLFGLWVEQDLHDPAHYAPYLLQGGLELPDRQYYLADSARMAKIRDAYKAHLAKMLTLMGEKDPAGEAQRIFDLETAIAKVHAPRDESEDIQKADNRWSRASFSAKAPGLDWTAFFTAAGLQARPTFYVWHPKATTGEAALVASEPLSTWKEYLALHQVEHHAGVLPKAFVDERFAMFGTVLRGTPQNQVRWKRGVSSTSAALQDDVGKL